MSAAASGKPDGTERDGLKWFFAVSAATLDFYTDYDMRSLIKVALLSALRNTRLRPHLIYDGGADAFMAEMRALGAEVILHRTPLYSAFEAHVGANFGLLSVMAGAFLRFEVPVLETQEEFALYTDCDVLFLRHPDFGPDRPQTFGATSEFSTDAARDLNSGIMVLNLAAMRACLPELNAFTRRSLHIGLDQDILKAFFGHNYLVLDRSVNWKPYWGWNPAAQIVHFHGPKPLAARNYLINGTAPNNPAWAELLTWNRVGYEAYTRLWYSYYDRMAATAI